MRILKADQYIRMPWRNGHGETAQVAIHPASATLDDLHWRVSMARIDGDGAFSIFPGTDRTIAVLRGDGLHLSVAGLAPVALTRGSEPVVFPGDVTAHATLIGGTVTDLNVMTLRNRYTHSMRSLRVARHGDFAVESPLALLICTDEPVQVEVNSQTVRLNALDSLLLDETPMPMRISSDAPALTYLIEIRPVRAHESLH